MANASPRLHHCAIKIDDTNQLSNNIWQMRSFWDLIIVSWGFGVLIIVSQGFGDLIIVSQGFGWLQGQGEALAIYTFGVCIKNCRGQCYRPYGYCNISGEYPLP